MNSKLANKNDNLQSKIADNEENAMKKVLGSLVVASTFVLTACGGGGSSESSYTATFSKTLANKNEYSCPTQVAFNACTDDASCKVAKCTITKEVTKPVDTTTLKACTIDGNNIYGTKGESCTFSIANVNNDATETLVCDSNGKASTRGMSSPKINLGDKTLSCK